VTIAKFVAIAANGIALILANHATILTVTTGTVLAVSLARILIATNGMGIVIAKFVAVAVLGTVTIANNAYSAEIGIVTEAVSNGLQLLLLAIQTSAFAQQLRVKLTSANVRLLSPAEM